MRRLETQPPAELSAGAAGLFPSGPVDYGGEIWLHTDCVEAENSASAAT